MKLVRISLAFSLLGLLLPLSSLAAPDTTGKFSIGGRSKMGLSPISAAITSASDANAALNSLFNSSSNGGLLSLRYGLNNSMNITGFVGLDITSRSIETTSGDETVRRSSNSNTFTLGGQFDYIIAQLEKSRITAGAGIFLHGLGGSSENSDNNNTTVSTSSPMVVSIVPTIGYEYFLAPQLSLEGAVGLPISFSSSSTGNTDTSSFSMNVAFSPFVGMNYYF